MNLDHSELEFSTYDPVAGRWGMLAQFVFVLKQAEDGTAVGEVCRKAPEPPENGSVSPVEIVLRNGHRMLAL